MRHLIAILCALVCLSGCLSNTYSRKIAELEARLAEKQEQDNVAMHSPTFMGTVKKVIIPVETQKIITDNSSRDALIMTIGMILVAFSAAALVILSWIAPPLRPVAWSGLVGGGALIIISTLHQFSLPYMPYIVAGILCVIGVFGIMGVIYAIRHIDWTPDEKQGVLDLANGLRETEHAKKILNDVKSHQPIKLLAGLRGGSRPSKKVCPPRGGI